MAKKKSAAKKPVRKRPQRHIQLRVIPEPEPNTRSVIVFTGEGTVVMRGPKPNIVMECGNCAASLVEGVPVANLQSLVLRCPNCGAFNETLA
jgi:hypothetical protein